MLMRPCLVLAMLVALLVSGCGGTRTASQKTEQSTLKPLAVFYGRYISSHMGQPPPNEEEFKKFVSSLPAEDLKGFNLTSADQVFVSDRDKQPYKVIYGVPSGPPGPAGAPVIAYEQQGVGGKRFVASNLGAVEEVDEAKFKEYVPNP
jgi:hypothetical protein